MKLYFAPMEGITGYIFRNAHHRYFTGIDRYYTPFITTHKNKELTSREKNDILPEHNEGIAVVPQILSNNGEDFIKMARILCELGYKEINLNLGCPSKTVVTKQKGAGFLAEKEKLHIFLEQIFSGVKDCAISIKTRIGMDAVEEWEELLNLFNQYPVKELIVHPRIQKEYYNGNTHQEIWQDTLKNSKNPLCYNGDLFTEKQMDTFVKTYPDTKAIMLGRGLLVYPGLADRWKAKQESGENTDWEGSIDYNKIREFHDEVYDGYQRIMSGERNVLFKMKELWFYLIHSFPIEEKMIKKIRKAEKLSEYNRAVNAVFQMVNKEI